MLIFTCATLWAFNPHAYGTKWGYRRISINAYTLLIRTPPFFFRKMVTYIV